MKALVGRVAVITGAASGIGRAIAVRCAREGMKMVLADVEEQALLETTSRLQEEGATALAVVTDVSKSEEVETLAEKSWETFGAVDLLCNNAGVSTSASILFATQADWAWVMGVNLWGVIHGVRAFVPRMVEQNTDCRVVNTASFLGLSSGPGQGVYRVSKHAVVALSETLALELNRLRARVKVSVLCPGLVNTQIVDSQRNRPAHLQSTRKSRPERPDELDKVRKVFEGGLPPEQVADHLFAAIREDRFYVLTHPELNDAIRTRMEGILGGPATLASKVYQDSPQASDATDDSAA